MAITIIVFCIIVLVAVWNGYVIRWKLTGKQKYSNIWHVVGFFVRLCLVAVVYINSGWLIALGAGFICWLPYNIIINIVNKWPIFYIGKTSKIDILIRKLFKL